MAEVIILKQDGSYTHVKVNYDRDEVRKNLVMAIQDAELNDNKMIEINGVDFDLIIDVYKIVEIMIKD